MANTQQYQQEGLFNVATPYDYQQQQDALFKSNAIAVAQLDPEAHASYNAMLRGRNIAQGVADLFGAKSKDPGLKRANDMDAIFKSLSEEDMKDPAGAMNKVADQMANLGYTQDAINYRLKSYDIAQTQISNETTNTLNKFKIEEGKVKRIGQMANGMLESFKTLNDDPVLVNQAWSKYIDEIEKNFGKEEADKRRGITDVTAIKAQLTKDFESSETNITSNQEKRLEIKTAADKAAASVKAAADVSKAATLAAAKLAHETKMFTFRYAKLAQQGNIEALNAQEVLIKGQQELVNQLDREIAEANDSIALYNDPIKSPLLTAQSRTQALQSLEVTKADLVRQRDAARTASSNLESSYASGITKINAPKDLPPAPGASPSTSNWDQAKADEDWKTLESIKGTKEYAGALDYFNNLYPGYSPKKTTPAPPPKPLNQTEKVKAELADTSWIDQQISNWKANKKIGISNREVAKKLLKDKKYIASIPRDQVIKLRYRAAGF